MDRRERELERGAGSGDVEARAKLLIEQVRRGGLSEGRLRLAAQLGDEASARAVGTDPSTTLQDAVRPVWEAHEPVVVMRVVLALSRLSVLVDRPDLEHYRAGALWAVEDWCLRPCSENAVAALTATGHILEGMDEWESDQAAGDVLHLLAKTASLASQLQRCADGEESPKRTPSVNTFRPPDLTDDVMLAAIRDEVVPWALGVRDPVRERVEARRQEPDS